MGRILKKYRFLYYSLLVGVPVAVMATSLFVGRYPVSPGEVFLSLGSIFSQSPFNNTDPVRRIILYIRLPRTILAMLVGGSLAVSGASLQGLFRNPLVSSGMLGVSAGAGFGAALSIVLIGTSYMTVVFSFSFGLLAVILSFLVGRIYNARAHITLVLGGLIIGSMFSAMTSFLKYIADPYDQLPAIVFWLMGSLASARYQDILLSGIPIAAGCLGLMIFSYRINVLSMGDREAGTLGMNVPLSRIFVVLCTTLATAGAVCVSGSINWVGLIIPHMGRMIIGSDNRDLIPFSFSLGGCFLIIVDIVSRSISSSEIPLGILTALMGAPFFIYLLYRTKARGW